MAYFPNGTAGAIYEEQYCDRCIHRRGADGESGCPIWLLHLLYNYEQCAETPRGEAIDAILKTLIPEEGIYPQQCSMFRPTVNAEAEEAELRRLAEQPRKYEAVMAERRQLSSEGRVG